VVVQMRVYDNDDWGAEYGKICWRAELIPISGNQDSGSSNKIVD